MASFLASGVQRALRSSIKKGAGGSGKADTELILVVVICFGVLSSCIFLIARGIHGKLGRAFLSFANELKYMLTACCRRRQSSRQGLASVPVAKPDVQPAPLRFTARQANIPSRNHLNTERQHQPRLPQVYAVSNENTSKVSRERLPAVATQDVPRLLGRERSLAIPWSVLESDSKCKRYKKKSGSNHDCLPNSNKPDTFAKAASEPLPTRVEYPVATAPSGLPLPSALPTLLRRSEFEKNDQRHRKQPCYGSSCRHNASANRVPTTLPRPR